MQYSIVLALGALTLPGICVAEPSAALVDGPAGYTIACSINSAPHLHACDELPSARSCAVESNYPSLASKESTGITFVNRSAEPIKIYWLSFQGERRLYQFLPPGARRTQQTFIGHNWLVTNLADQCIGVFGAAPVSIAFF
jgi:VHL beta domain